MYFVEQRKDQSRTAKVTKYISNKNWYFEYLDDPGVEHRSTKPYLNLAFLEAVNLIPGDTVTILKEKYLDSKLTYTQEFLDFLEESDGKEFIIVSSNRITVQLSDCKYAILYENLKRVLKYH